MDPDNQPVEENKNVEVAPTVEKTEEVKVPEPDQTTEVPAKTEQKLQEPPKTQQKPKTEQKPQESVKTESKPEESTKKDEKKEQIKVSESPKASQKKEQKKDENQKTMKCIMLSEANKFSVMEVPIPKPSSGEVLVKVMAAPINPSDLALYTGNYEKQKKFPTIMGFEGSGLVVESGGGLMGWGLVGKKVAFAVEKQGEGSYAQYTIIKSQQCLPLSDDTTFEEGCMSIVNPLTALGMLDILKQKKQKSVVFTAAASALGRMVNRIFQKEGVEVINVVRRAEQVDLLKKQGARYVLNSSQENFETDLRVLAEKIGVKTCYEAIGGDFTGVILRNMPKNSTVTVYGCLSMKNLGNIDVGDLMFGNKIINTFMLGQWLRTKNQLTLLPFFYKVRSNISQNMKSVVAKKFKLDQFEQGLQFYLKNMTEGKVLFEPWSE